MKVFIYIGSPRGENSTEYLLFKTLKSKIESTHEEIKVNIFRDDLLKIKEHSGEPNDFILGNTLYQDDMVYIEQEMLSSDFIIFSSPVYIHNVSAQMKIFLDRIAYWLHTFRLVGKVGCTVSSSNNNGNAQVREYLEKIMDYLGVYTFNHIELLSESFINNPHYIDAHVEYIFEVIHQSMQPMKLDFSGNSEKYFKTYKNLFLNEKRLTMEKDFWIKNNYFDYDSFEDLFKSKTNLILTD